VAPVRQRALALAVLALALLASGWRHYRLRNYLEFLDESAEMTTGWLLSEGETLYGSVFSHHMPLAAALAHAVAAVSPEDNPADFRVAPWAAYALLGLAGAFGPLARRNPVAAPLAGAALVAVASTLAPLLLGHMLLNEVFWGVAVAAAFLLVPLPLVLGVEPGGGASFAAGAAAALAVAASPLAVPPLVFAAGLALLARPGGGLLRAAAPVLAGALGAGAALGAWALRFADLPGFRREVLEFNADVYSRFVGLTPLTAFPETLRLWGLLFSGAPREAMRGDVDALLVPPLLVSFLLLAAVCVRRARATPGPGGFLRGGGLILLAALFVFSLRMRSGGFHALPLHLAVAAVAVVLPWAAGFRAPGLAAAAVALSFLPVLGRALADDSLAFDAAERRPAVPAVSEAARWVRAHTSPDECIAAFPTLPLVYLEARRRPATDTVFFLPWQAVREEQDPSVTSVCAQLAARPPRYVVLQETTIWGAFEWKVYARCVDRFLKKAYEPAGPPAVGGLVLVRRDARP
jgi:hypothetical protein